MDINVLVDKYFNAETSIAEEKFLKTYFNSCEGKRNNTELSLLFSYFQNSANCFGKIYFKRKKK